MSSLTAGVPGSATKWLSLGARLGLPRKFAAGLLGTIAALGAWQLIAVALVANPNLPSATATLGRLGSLAGTGPFWTAVAQTLITAVVGFLASLPLAIPLGIAMGTSLQARRALHVLVEVLKPIPPIVILPLVILEAGSTERMAEILIIFTVVPSLVVIVAAGVRDTDPVALNTARSFRLSRWAQVRRIVIPSAMPFVITGLRISITAAVLTAVMAEIVGGAPGLGAQVNVARSAGDPISTFAYVVALGLLGVVVTYGVNAVERRLLRWHVSIRGTRTESPTRLGGGLRRTAASSLRSSRASQTVSAFTSRVELLYLRVAGRLRNQWQAITTPFALIQSKRTSLRARSSKQTLPGWLLELGVPVALVAAWWVLTAGSHNIYFPSLWHILETFQQIWLFSHFVSDVLPSLRNLFAGLAAGCLVGLLIGLVMAEVPYLGDMLDPVLIFFRSVPGVAYVPIMILLIGFTAPMRIVSIGLASLFPVLIATFDGLRSVDTMMQEVSRSYSLSPLRRLTYVRLPAAAPRIASGIEIAIAVAVVVMVASELEGTVHGIGAQTILAQQNFEIPAMWAGILLLAMLGLAINLLYHVVRVRVLRWYYQSRALRTA